MLQRHCCLIPQPSPLFPHLHHMPCPPTVPPSPHVNSATYQWPLLLSCPHSRPSSPSPTSTGLRPTCLSGYPGPSGGGTPAASTAATPALQPGHSHGVRHYGTVFVLILTAIPLLLLLSSVLVRLLPCGPSAAHGRGAMCRPSRGNAGKPTSPGEVMPETKEAAALMKSRCHRVLRGGS